MSSVQDPSDEQTVQTPGYQHTQHGRWYLLIPLMIALLLIMDAILPGPPLPLLVYLLVAGIVGVVSLTFNSLTVRDDGNRLTIRFGPIPLFGFSIPYAKITQVEKDRTRFGDGWGIHYVLARGWIYNVWGFDCVRIECGRRVYRVGTDDPDGLYDFLSSKIQDLQEKPLGKPVDRETSATDQRFFE